MPRRSTKKDKAITQEFKIAIIVSVILGMLFLFDFVINPVETDKDLITGNVVADVQPEVDTAPAPKITEVSILSPTPGSIQNGEFTVQIEVPPEATQCYYLIKNNGQITHDRRTPNCGKDVVVKEIFCPTSGTNTCSFYYDAENDGVRIGEDQRFFSIR